MLKLNGPEYDEALMKMAQALRHTDMATELGKASVMLEALGRDFDVAPIDPGPRDDIESGEVWPERETDLELGLRAFTIPVGKKPISRFWQ